MKMYLVNMKNNKAETLKPIPSEVWICYKAGIRDWQNHPVLDRSQIEQTKHERRANNDILNDRYAHTQNAKAVT